MAKILMAWPIPLLTTGHLVDHTTTATTTTICTMD